MQNSEQSSKPRNMLIFGGNPSRMYNVKTYLSQIENLNITGVFSEEEGLDVLQRKENNSFDLILIGGRYTNEQRERILSSANNILITQPGIDYPYSDENIYLHVERLLNSLTE